MEGILIIIILGVPGIVFFGGLVLMHRSSMKQINFQVKVRLEMIDRLL